MYALFRLCRAAAPHMPEGASIIATSSIQAFQPSPHLLDYATAKAVIVNFEGAGQGPGEQGDPGELGGVRSGVDAAHPGHHVREKIESFGQQAPVGRAAQPAELAPAYVCLASQESSFVTAEVVAVTGGSPIT